MMRHGAGERNLPSTPSLSLESMPAGVLSAATAHVGEKVPGGVKIAHLTARSPSDGAERAGAGSAGRATVANGSLREP